VQFDVTIREDRLLGQFNWTVEGKAGEARGCARSIRRARKDANAAARNIARRAARSRPHVERYAVEV
jgi:hypothetical protein